jgi:hypothetical protein
MESDTPYKITTRGILLESPEGLKGLEVTNWGRDMELPLEICHALNEAFNEGYRVGRIEESISNKSPNLSGFMIFDEYVEDSMYSEELKALKI